MPSGIKCPHCACGMHRVVQTYPEAVVEVHGKRITVIKRRRRCRHCKTTWYTFERNEEDMLREDVELDLLRPEKPQGNPNNPYLDD